MKILLTAFEPFGGEQTNAALKAVERVNAPEGVTLCKLIIPTVFGLCTETVMDMVRSFTPDAVICIGQATGRNAIFIERVAVNLRNASIPDNAGNHPVDAPIDPDGPAACFSTLPVKAMRDAILAEGIPCELSYSAGTFVCNDLMYGVLHALVLEASNTIAGFIHVPSTPAQAVLSERQIPFMETSLVTKGIEAALSSLI